MKYKILLYPVIFAIIIFFASCSGIKGNIYKYKNNIVVRFPQTSRNNSNNNENNNNNNENNNNNNNNSNNSINNNTNNNINNNINNDHDDGDNNNNHSSATIPKSDKKLKLYIKTKNEIELWTEITDNTTLIMKFGKKDWGTWNIIGWYSAATNNIIGNKKSFNGEDVNIITGGSTDWEYVFRIVNPQGNKWYFSGGNHGNERLKSISFLNLSSQNHPNDYDINSDIKLEPGKIIELASLKVKEVTALDVQEIGLKEYATVYREYIFEPQGIQLAARFKFNTDVSIGTSYVAMFPILKEHGRYCRFDDSGIVVETLKTGYTEAGKGKESYLGKVATLSTTLWGDNKPGYRFRVWIDRSEMADNFNNQLKVFLWDLNKFSNKLYYSKYDTSKPVEVKAGTEWFHKQGWDFIYVD